MMALSLFLLACAQSPVPVSGAIYCVDGALAVVSDGRCVHFGLKAPGVSAPPTCTSYSKWNRADVQAMPPATEFDALGDPCGASR